jgi:hypothetical protein
LRVGKTAEHQIHFPNPTMPATEQQPPPSRIQPVARKVRSCTHPGLQRQKPGRGRGGLYRGLVAPCQPPVCTGLHCVGIARAPACARCGHSSSIPCLLRSPACLGWGRNWRSFMPICSIARLHASSICYSTCRQGSSTGAHGQNCATRCRTRSLRSL